MGQLGDMFPGAKLRRETPDDAGDGQQFEPGPLDLDGGVIRVRPRTGPKTATPTDGEPTGD
jgi:hypothetical protein